MMNSDKLKIYLVSIQYPPNITGGGGVIVRELSRELEKKRDDVTVLCFGLQDKEEEKVLLSDNDGYFKLQTMRFFAKDSDTLKNPYEGTKQDEFNRFEEFTDKVFEYLKDKEGIIHLHGHYLVPLLAKRIKEEGMKNPSVISYHALESIALEAKQVENKQAFEYIREREKLSLGACDLAFVNSNKVKIQLKEMFPEEFNDGKVVVISNPVNNELVTLHAATNNAKLDNRKKYNIKEDASLLLSVGRIDKIKGYDILVDSMETVAKGYTNNLALVIAGFLEDKNKDFYELINKKAEKIMKNYPHVNIVFIPNIPNDDKNVFLDDCLLFVGAAILEPFGITALESWVRGKPVVSSETEGSKDLFDIEGDVESPYEIKDKGIVVNYKGKRDDRLGEAILHILNNVEEAEKMGKVGKEFVLDKYTWKGIVKTYRDHYKSLL